MYTAEAYGRTFYIHPSVVEQKWGKFEFPIYNCEVIEVTGRTVVVIPGTKMMRVFEMNDEKSEIEDAYKSRMMYYNVFDREEWREKTKAVVIIASPTDKKTPIIEWVDGNGSRWMSTVDIQTGTIETVPNPKPPPSDEDEDE